MRTFKKGLQTQRLAVADLTKGGVEAFAQTLGGRRAAVVYSDPPWNPGNEKYWRRFAGEAPPTSYDVLLDAWCRCVALARPDHVFVEQSVNPKHKTMLLRAIERCEGWTLPFIEEWVCQYGSPKRPNALLHFGREKLSTDPSGMSGVVMVKTVFDGLPSEYFRLHGSASEALSLIVDPCMGLGTTSRVAHALGWDCAGTELNQARLERTIGKLIAAGYVETAP